MIPDIRTNICYSLFELILTNEVLTEGRRPYREPVHIRTGLLDDALIEEGGGVVRVNVPPSPVNLIRVDLIEVRVAPGQVVRLQAGEVAKVVRQIADEHEDAVFSKQSAEVHVRINFGCC